MAGAELGQAQWCVPVIAGTWEAEAGGLYPGVLLVQCRETLSKNKHLKRAGDAARGSLGSRCRAGAGGDTASTPRPPDHELRKLCEAVTCSGNTVGRYAEVSVLPKGSLRSSWPEPGFKVDTEVLQARAWLR